MEQEVPNTNTPVALVVGVTGMAGLSLAEALKSPTALGGPWKVYGSARHAKPTWFPSSTLDHYITFDALNFDDTLKHLSPIAHEITHVFWVAIQVRENEESNIAANSTMLENVIKALKSATPSRLCHITLQTDTKHYMSPIFDPVLGTRLVRHEPPFHEDMPRLPYPNFYYALEDLLASYSPSLTYSVHRSSIIVGASSRSFYNVLLTLCVYATICRYQGLPFRYPGTKYAWENFCDMSDARVLAEQQIWAAVTDRAKNQAFNCTNGDVFTWKCFWKVCCEIFDVEFVPFDENEKFDWVGMMKKKGRVWDEIVEKYGLYKTNMEEIICPEALDAVLHFSFPHVCSMNKSREFGFFGYANTLKSIGMWVGRLRDMKIIP
nr:3-oxo-Delta(4,5)-steroid 5-beta-reductase-like [Quercus suber]POE70981.1 isoform 2 of 3-oxo-delta(4,5)-steroid 5-beta-reductase [Quercus suber]